MLFLSGLTTFAQEGIVTGKIRDLLTENAIDSTAVTLLTADSAKVSAADSMGTESKGWCHVPH